MNNQCEDHEQKQADMLSGVLPAAAIFFGLAAIPGFLMAGWIAALCLLILGLVIYSLGAILDLLLAISRSLKRLESKIDKRADKQ